LKAVGVWFRSSATGRYLYLLRNDTRHPGTWGLPGGKVESGETLLGAMERECIEELGSILNINGWFHWKNSHHPMVNLNTTPGCVLLLMTLCRC